MLSKDKHEGDGASLRIAAGAYPIAALQFVQNGFGRASEAGLVETSQLSIDERHISGQQLCFGLLEYAIEQYGLMAPVVLHRWNVQRTDDFGRIVFALIELGVLRKSPTDSIDDFRSVFDFDEVFSPQRLRKQVLGTNG
ncbi:MAG: hypothetical protein EXS01_01915 [Phycisphaerales bacterium]|nr:hypothetical protein [Phycisphaerales bacterium]